jgi:hypothetical protein
MGGGGNKSSRVEDGDGFEDGSKTAASFKFLVVLANDGKPNWRFLNDNGRVGQD